MEFLYFQPNGVERGDTLDYVSDSFSERPQQGPDEQRGRILSGKVAGPVSRIIYRPDLQTWRKIPGSDLWVGFYKDDPPTPEDLSREDQIPGHQVKLGDDQSWLVPVARQFTDAGKLQPALPATMDLDQNGNWTIGDVVPKHRKLWDASTAWLDFMMQLDSASGTDETIEISVFDVADSCVVALSTNYRVSKIEVAMLGLLTDATRADIMNATIDLPTFLDHLKKNETAEPSDTGPGSTERTPDTVPA